MMQNKKVLQFKTEADFFDFAREQYNHNSSFYMFDLTSLEKQYYRFTSFLPRVTPFYAVKCNPDIMLVQTLYSLGCGLDCASKGELEQAINELHADPDRIIFANPCKLPAHIEYMKEIGVKRTTFDCVAELEKIKAIYPTCELVLRLATDDSKSRMPLSVVYGAKKEEWEILVHECKRLDLNLVGISFHIGSGSTDPTNFYDAIRNASIVFSIAEQYGYKLTLLDIGGGFPGISEDPQILLFEEFAGQVNIALDEFFGDKKDLTIIAEPGRYFANGAMYAFLKVIGRKIYEPESYKNSLLDEEKLSHVGQKYEIDNDFFKRKEIYDYYVNESTNIFFTILLMEHNAVGYIHLLNEHKDEQKYKSNIYGYSSAKNELLVSEVLLPKIDIGEEVYFKNVGSYSSSLGYGTQINGYQFDCERFYFTINSLSNLSLNETFSSTSSSIS